MYPFFFVMYFVRRSNILRIVVNSFILLLLKINNFIRQNYYNLLIQWNKIMNLTAITTKDITDLVKIIEESCNETADKYL